MIEILTFKWNVESGKKPYLSISQVSLFAYSLYMNKFFMSLSLYLLRITRETRSYKEFFESNSRLHEILIKLDVLRSEYRKREIRGQFHQHYTSRFYTCRFQKRKKDRQVASLFLRFRDLHMQKLFVEC